MKKEFDQIKFEREIDHYKWLIKFKNRERMTVEYNTQLYLEFEIPDRNGISSRNYTIYETYLEIFKQFMEP